MIADATRVVSAALLTALAGSFGCEKSQTPTESQRRESNVKTTAKPAQAEAAEERTQQQNDTPAPPSPSAGDERESAGTVIDMQGVTMAVPDGWVAQPVEPGPMSPEHVFTLPPAEGNAEPAELRVTYFPNMKGMDDANIQRWIAQVKRPDGSSYTREDVEVSVTESGDVRLTVVDLAGIVQATMRANPKPNHRMIAAIVDHPQGPHFVVAAGPVDTIAKWEDEIGSFLGSATVK